MDRRRWRRRRRVRQLPGRLADGRGSKRDRRRAWSCNACRPRFATRRRDPTRIAALGARRVRKHRRRIAHGKIVEVEASGPGRSRAARPRFELGADEDGGRAELRGRGAGARGAIAFAFETATGDEVVANSNPDRRFGDAGPRVLWGDRPRPLGAVGRNGLPRRLLPSTPARWPGLDVVALSRITTTGGSCPWPSSPELWQEIRSSEATQRRARARALRQRCWRFEWTSWIHGHRHVLYFDADEAR